MPNKLYNHLLDYSFYFFLLTYMLIKAISLSSHIFIVICSIFLFVLMIIFILHVKKLIKKANVFAFINIAISIIMVEFLLRNSLDDNSYTTYLTGIMISQIFSLEYLEKNQYNIVILSFFYVYLGVRFWESSSDHIIQFILLLLSAVLKGSHSNLVVLQKFLKKNDPKTLMVNYFLQYYPTLTILLKEKTEKKSDNIFNDFPFDLIFSNETARKEYGIKDSNSVLNVLDNIQLNSNDILNQEQSPNYSPTLKSKKFGKLSNYCLHLISNRAKNLPTYQKFLVSYSRKLTSSFENAHSMTNIKQSQFRVILILFEYNGKLSILVNMEDSNLEDQLKKLKEMDIYKDEMLASITHDLKSPLSSVLTLICNAKGMLDNEERGKNLDYAIHNGNLLLNQINDILDYAQMRRGKFSLFFTHFTLNQILDDVLKLMKIQADLKGIELKIDNQCVGEGNPNFYSDYRRIKQILINLICNALKFTITGKIVIKVTQTESPNVVKFEVIDTGVGMKEEIIKQLGKPFHSFENEAEGVGLGLHICKTIIGQLGPFDKIHVSSHIGSGSKFGFLIYLTCDKKNQKFSTADQIEHPFNFQEIRKRVDPKLDEEFSAFYSKEFCNSDFDEKKNQIETNQYLFSKNTNNNDLKIFLSSTKILPEKLKEKSSSSEQCVQENLKEKKSPRKSNFFAIKKEKSMTITHETSLNEIVLKKNAKKFRILLVDDDPFNMFIMKGYLKKLDMTSLNVIIEYDEAINGVYAYELFKQKNIQSSLNPYKIVILDCHMPIQNGFKTAKLIKSAVNDEGYMNCKIIGYSALHGNNEETKCFEYGMDLFMPKPISVDDFNDILVSQIKTFL